MHKETLRQSLKQISTRPRAHLKDAQCCFAWHGSTWHESNVLGNQTWSTAARIQMTQWNYLDLACFLVYYVGSLLIPTDQSMSSWWLQISTPYSGPAIQEGLYGMLLWYNIHGLSHQGWDQMATIWQTTFLINFHTWKLLHFVSNLIFVP